MRGLARVGWIAACAVGLSVACSGKTTTTGELMLAMNTDMSLPKDVDEVRIQIKVSGRVMYDDRYSVGPGDGKVKIPATLGVVAGNDVGAIVRIKVSASRNHKSRMLREVTTTVPPDRVALLRVPIQWISDGSAIDVDGDDVVSACPDGQTNIAGTCQDMSVSSADLPSYTPADVFGGGAEGGGGGTCFDTVPCFAQASTAQVDLTSCTIPAQSGDLTKVNVGLTLALGDDGICNDAACYIGLDANSPAGWNFMGGTSGGGPASRCDACPAGTRCDANGVCQPVSAEQDAGAVTPPPFDDAGARIPAPRIKPLGDPLLGDAGAAPLGGPIQLPKAICEKLKSGRVKSVVTSFTCPSKTERNPACGPWSAISGGTSPTNPPSPQDASIADAPIDGTWRLDSKVCNGQPVDMTGWPVTTFAISGKTGRITNQYCQFSITLSYPAPSTVEWIVAPGTCKDPDGGPGTSDTHTATYVLEPNLLTLTEAHTPAGEYGCSSGRQVSTLSRQSTSTADGGSCNPRPCAAQLPACGVLDDGCGQKLDCFGCPAGSTCGGGGTPNVCGAPPCVPKTCGPNCGQIDNGCGQPLDCGGCSAPATCGGGGIPNVCGP